MRSPAERMAAATSPQESCHAESPATTGDCGIATRSGESRHAESCHAAKGSSAGGSHGDDDPWSARRRALRGHLRRARGFRERIDDGQIANAAALATKEGLTSTRVYQLLRLLDLAPAIVADLEDEERSGPVPTERALGKLVGAKPDGDQVERYHQLCEVEAARQEPGASTKKPSPTRRGFQHLFRRARRYQGMLDSGEARSMEAIARAEGISGTRVRQITLLLQLPPRVLEQVDVVADSLPPNLTERSLRRVASARSRRQQATMWRALLRGV